MRSFQNRLGRWLLAGVILSGLMWSIAQAETPIRIRGTIISFDGRELEVKTRDGKNLKLNIPDDTGIRSLVELKMDDIKQGSFVGVTAIKKGSAGQQYALEVHVFPESSRGTGEGHFEWDLEPGSTMTNANVEAIVEMNDGKELTLSYKGGKQKIIVPPDIPIVTFVDGDKSQLMAGKRVFISAQQAGNGMLTAQRILVGKAGLEPPM